MPVSRHAARFLGGNRMLEMTNENLARLLRGLTIAVGNRRNRILLYQFLAAEIRALHCSYGVGDGESYKRALTFLENCERYTLRSLVRRSAKHHAEMTVDHAKRVFSRALKKLDTSQGHDPTLGGMIVHLLKQEPLQTNSQPSRNAWSCRVRGGMGLNHSITSSVRASSVGGTVRPSAFAALRLMTSSNLVGCSIGRSAGLAPLKILSM